VSARTNPERGEEAAAAGETIGFLGAGRFGLLALERLSFGRPDREFLVVDRDERALARAVGPRRSCRLAEGVGFLAERLGERCGSPDADPTGPPSWIVPALPLHVAAEWCLHGQPPDGLRRLAPPPELASRVPNPVPGLHGDLYVSQADFLCPDDCPEPRGRCTATGRPRGAALFDLLGRLELPGHAWVVLRSRQLGRGVGGYRASELLSLRARVARATGPSLVATACRCHGVITAIGRRGL
jgi:hypothetical protein